MQIKSLEKGERMKIAKITAREIFDSRGTPTIACTLILEDGHKVYASVPSGISVSAHEAVSLRDGGSRLRGLGTLRAVENIEHIIAPQLIGFEPNLIQMDMKMIELDDTENKSHLGANAMLAVSLAVCRAQAYLEQAKIYELIAYLCEIEVVSLPGPMFNVINGGAHASNNLAIQEFMIMPLGMNSFHAAMELCVEIYHALGEYLIERGKSIAVGDEGGFAPDFENEIEALDFLMEVISRTENMHDGSIMISLDVAASQLYDKRSDCYRWHNTLRSADEMIAWYNKIVDQYPIYSIEDGLDEDDWTGWEKMSAQLKKKVKLVGDDIFATNPHRIMEGIERDIAQNIVIKPNQIGTLTETLQAIKLCNEYDRNVVVSHRSGDTCDSFIADLAVAVSASQIKAGGCARSERLSKYNRLLEIEDELIMTY